MGPKTGDVILQNAARGISKVRFHKGQTTRRASRGLSTTEHSELGGIVLEATNEVATW